MDVEDIHNVQEYLFKSICSCTSTSRVVGLSK